MKNFVKVAAVVAVFGLGAAYAEDMTTTAPTETKKPAEKKPSTSKSHKKAKPAAAPAAKPAEAAPEAAAPK